MAGPLNGLGGQQIPLANTFQPSQNSAQVRAQEERQPEEKKVQPRGTAAAESQDTESRNDGVLQERIAAALSAEQASGRDEVRRGSVVDITV